MADLATTEAPDAEAAPGPRRLDRSFALVLGAFAVVLALAAGFGIGIWVAAPRSPGEASAEAGFARDMVTHHAQAVSMATTEYRATADGGLRSISVDIALTQQGQIGIMSTWLDTWGLPATGSDPPMAWMADGGRSLGSDGRMPGMATDAEMKQLRELTGRAQDVLFCRLMIRHHLGGIHMAEEILSVTDDSQVRALAQSIKDGQQYEVTVLQDVLKRLGATP